MKLFLGIAAVLAWLIGLMLVLAPTQFYAPTGIALTPMLATVAQAHGATLFGLGTINWFARRAEGQGLVAVLVGNLVTQVLSFAVAARTAALGAGLAVAPAFVIHTVLGACFIVALVRATNKRRIGASLPPASPLGG
ncbi:MAG TPA: hypothetical protein VN706_15760 [Gemmatimonadaceae bacterium]|nr:hypothetical protein [Gemmatimonadaceae bacterium]